MAKILNAGAGPGERGLRVRGGRGVVRPAGARRRLGLYQPKFERLAYRVNIEADADGRPRHRGDGQGPRRRRGACTRSARATARSNALDGALRKALLAVYPRLAEMQLVDYKVRVVNARAGTAARVRVVIESRDGDDVWGTVGVSENIIEASWLALVDSFEYKLFKDEEKEVQVRRETLVLQR